MLPVPTPQSYKQGRQGLLDVLVNNSMASPLDRRLAEIKVERVDEAATNFAAQLSARGFNTRNLGVIGDDKTRADFKEAGDSNAFAAKDYRDMRREGIDRLLLLRVQSIGTQRGYYGFIPLGAPVALFSTEGQLIDLSNNRILWDKKILTTMPIVAPWDEEPYYPNLSQAVVTNATNGVASLEHAFFVVTNADTLTADEMTIPVTTSAPVRAEVRKEAAPAAPLAPSVQAAPIAAQPQATQPQAPVPAAAAPNRPTPAPQTIQPVAKMEAPLPAPASAPALPPTAVARPAPARNDDFKLGTSSWSVERLAKDESCLSDRGAEIISPEGPTEFYRVQCRDGRILQARCELRQCALQQ
ncbi:MAG TPA: hypothetical protein VIF60_06115 [Burkholderiaceae bacterium]